MRGAVAVTCNVQGSTFNVRYDVLPAACDVPCNVRRSTCGASATGVAHRIARGTARGT